MSADDEPDLSALGAPHSHTMAQLRLAHQGDQRAMGELFASVEAKLLLYIRMRYRTPGQVGARESAEDLLQRTYVEAMRAFDTYEYQGKGSFFCWMREIARLIIARTFEEHKKVKKRAVDREVPMGAMSPTEAGGIGVGTDPTPSQKVSLDEKLAGLSRALLELPDHYREVIVLHKLEELTFAETAARTGRTEPACKMIYLRAMTQLRSLLREHYTQA